MPEITLFGWFHTIIGITALVSGIYSLAKHKVILGRNTSGKVYLLCTLVAAASALGIYHQGDGFNPDDILGSLNPAHHLAILTLVALFGGRVAETTKLFGRLSPYLQATAYSATFLFHSIPAITDGLMRLPVDDPIVTNIEDPLLRGFYLAFLITYVVGLGLQIMWLRKNSAAD